MIGALLSWWHRRELARLRFPFQAEEGKEIAGGVLGTVSRGCVLGLRGASCERLEEAAASLPWDRRMFLHEGHALGVVGRTACCLSRRHPESRFRSPAFQEVRFLAYGYWDVLAGAYSAPRLRARAVDWGADDAARLRYRYLWLNGFGFAAAFLAGGLTAEVREGLSRYQGREREVALHGAGRALWFLYAGNYEALSRLLAEGGEARRALAAGLGFAVAATQSSRPEDVARGLDRLPAPSRFDLAGGAGAGLRVLARNDAEAERFLDAALAGELKGRYEAARDAARDPGRAADWYYFPL